MASSTAQELAALTERVGNLIGAVNTNHAEDVKWRDAWEVRVRETERNCQSNTDWRGQHEKQHDEMKSELRHKSKVDSVISALSAIAVSVAAMFAKPNS